MSATERSTFIRCEWPRTEPAVLWIGPWSLTFDRRIWERSYMAGRTLCTVRVAVTGGGRPVIAFRDLPRVA